MGGARSLITKLCLGSALFEMSFALIPQTHAKMGDEKFRPIQRPLPFKTSFDPFCVDLLTRLFGAPLPKTLTSVVEFEMVRKVDMPPKKHKSGDLGQAAAAKNVLGQALRTSIKNTQNYDEPWAWVEWQQNRLPDEATLESLLHKYTAFVYTEPTGQSQVEISNRILTGKITAIEGFRHTDGFPQGEPHDYKITLERPTGLTAFGTPIREELLLSRMNHLHALLPTHQIQTTGIAALDSMASHSTPQTRFQKFYFIYQLFEAEQADPTKGFLPLFKTVLKTEKEKGFSWKTVPLIRTLPRPEYDLGGVSPREYFMGQLVLGTWFRQLRTKSKHGLHENQIFVGKVVDVLAVGMNPLTNKNFVLVIKGPFGNQEIRFGETFSQEPQNLQLLRP